MRPTLTAAAGLLLFLPAALARADDARVVTTGIRVIAVIQVLPGVPTVKPPPPVPDAGAAVKVFYADGRKPVAEGKLDDKGVWLVELPPGTYRVEVAPTKGPAGAPPQLAEVKAGEVSEARFRFVIPLP